MLFLFFLMTTLELSFLMTCFSFLLIFFFENFLIVGFFSLFFLIATIPSGKVVLVTPDRGVWKFRASWLQGWPNNSRSQGLKIQYFLITRLTWRLLLMAGLIFSFFFESFLIIGLISSSSRSSVKTMIFLLSSTQWFFSLSTISLEFIEDLSWNKSKNVWCNVWRLDNMHASLLGLKYRSPPLWRSFVCYSKPSLFFCAISFVCQPSIQF